MEKNNLQEVITMRKLLLSLIASALIVPSLFAVDYNSDQFIKKEATITALHIMLLHNEFKNSPEVLAQKLTVLSAELIQKFALKHISASTANPKIKQEVTIYILNAFEIFIKANGSRELLVQEVQKLLLLDLELIKRLTPEECAAARKIMTEISTEVSKIQPVLEAETLKIALQIKDIQVKKTISQKICKFFSENKENMGLTVVGFMLGIVYSILT
jgi:hypothetical protein